MHVYMIECKKNGKKYIGSCISDNQSTRINRHKYQLTIGKHANQYMQNSWNSHGHDSFEFKVVEIIEFDHAKSKRENEVVIRKLEDEWISKENTLAPNGFNCKTAELRVPTEETRKRMSEAQKRRAPPTAETLLKLSAAHKGRVYTDESKKKMRESQLGEKSHWFGKHHTKETREKMSKSQHGRIISELHRERLKEANLRQEPIECPHCGKTGKPTPMKRWHFEKCRFMNGVRDHREMPEMCQSFT